MKRKTFALCLATISISAPAAPGVAAEMFSGARINIIVGTSAGGTYDLYARLLADHIGDHLPGHPGVIVTNMTGGGSVKAMNYVANVAPKDGTVMCAPEQGIPIAKALFGAKNLKFDVTEMNWIGTISRSYYMFGIWSDTPIKSIDDARTRKVRMSATGRNSTTNIYPLLVNAALGTKFEPVLGYRGAGGMNMAIEQGETWGRGGTWVSWQTKSADWIRDGKIRFILQIGLKKHPEAPDVPLLLDLVKDPEMKRIVEFMSVPTQVGRSVVAPPDVPKARVAALRKAFDETVKDPAFLAGAKKLDVRITGEPGVALQALMEKVEETPDSLAEKIRTLVGIKKK